VIGTGMAGMAATLFAAHRGLNVVQVGRSGEVIFASGLLDLLGVHPVAAKKMWHNPWAGMRALVRDCPRHPYARIQTDDIKAGLKEFLAFLDGAGLAYHRHVGRNVEILTSTGTAKLTHGVPETMWPGVEALKEKKSCLLIEFRGLKGFSARQITQVQKERWPDLRTARIDFPEMEGFSEVYTERMARALESSRYRRKLAVAVKAHLTGAKTVGLPAVMGISNSRQVASDLAERIGADLFEIPGMPPSVPGLRLKEAFERGLPLLGVTLFSQKQVFDVSHKKGRGFVLGIGRAEVEQTIQSKGVVLASGRFIGGGLYAGRDRIRETLFNLPINQPADRRDWHRKGFLDSRGHPINSTGLEVDDLFRPLGKKNRPVFEALFAAGSILAHQDWIRMKCGSGLAIATAFAAVDAFLKTGG
jgi:glycerol-3-phosphate dehydrogenase subunit B